jgi:hypothetical protein
MWDEEYSVEKYVYGTEPNDFLSGMTENLKKGRVLCLVVHYAPVLYDKRETLCACSILL